MRDAVVSEPDSRPVLVVSSRADRRHEWARQWLRQGLDHGPHRPGAFLLLGPSRGSADDFLRNLAREGSGVLGAHRFTLAQLAWQEASPHLAERSLARLTPLGAQAMAALAVDRSAGKLRRLAAVSVLPGFPRALASTLRDLRMAGVEPAQLAALEDTEGPSGPGHDSPGPDLGVLLEAYCWALDRWALADSALIFRRAAASLRARSERQGVEPGREVDWRGARTLCLDVPIRSSLETELLGALCPLQEQVAITAAHGDQRSIEAAAEILEVEPLDLDAILGAQPEPLTALERVQRYVFAAEIPPVSATEAKESDSLDFFSAGGEGQECVEIARRVRNLAAGSVPFDRIAIFVRQPTAYLPLIEDALRRAKIPAYFSRGTSRPDPAGRAFLALLACAAEGLPASRFAEYLSLGQVPLLQPDATPTERQVPWVEPEGEQMVLSTSLRSGADRTPDSSDRAPSASEPSELASPAIAGGLPTPAHWERLLVDAAVVGGADRWRRRLDGLEAELGRRAREIGDEDEPRRLGVLRSIERLGYLRRFALPLVDSLDDFPSTARWGNWIERLEGLATRSLRRPESVLALLADLRPLREVGPVSLAQVRRVLEERLGILRRKPVRRRFGRVFVGTLEEAAGRCFDVVFVPGLAEGVFPRRASEDPLLLDDLRERLAAGLEQQDERLHAERLLLHLALGAARHRAVLSYPRVDVALGRARVPSFYALDVLRAAEGEVPDLKSLALRAAAASGSLLGSSPLIGSPAGSAGSGPLLEQAIDASEYDLALLQDLFRRPPGEALGEGRFLLTVNEPLRRSLHSRARRWRRRWTYADGLVAGADTESSRIALDGFEAEGAEGAEGIAVLAAVDGSAVEAAELDRADALASLFDAESPQRRSFSPTSLQHFSACPYRFFLQAILRLRPREDRTGFEQLDPLTRGSIFHQVQFELHLELREAGMLPVTLDNVDLVLEVADRVFERSIARFTEELAPAIQRVWESEIESLRNDLRGWLRQVAGASGPWTPLHFELAFGLEKSADRDPASVEQPTVIARGRKVRGAIDLVEVDTKGKRLRVTDHKTGRPRRERDLVVGGGSVLQPLVYALAAERLLGSGHEGDTAGLQVVTGRLYYCTQRGEYSSLEVALNPEGRRAIEQVFQEVEAALEQRFLPAAPQKGACRWCDYRPVCGPYEESRVGRKDRRRLESLERLRRHR